MPEFRTLSKAELSEYNIVLCVDRSASMSFKDNNTGRSRWEHGEEFVRSFAEFADEVDDDGITVITFGSTVDVVDGVRAATVHDLFAKKGPGGSTPLAQALAAAADKHFSSNKRTIVVVATDGVPDDKLAVQNVIVNASRKLGDKGELRFGFVQIGEDAAAARYLDELDDDLVGKQGAKFDIVDAINHERAINMDYEAMLSKFLVD